MLYLKALSISDRWLAPCYVRTRAASGMLTISKPLSAAQAQTYHAESFANARENYYSAGDTIVGHWHGRLAERWGLSGAVDPETFGRLAQGQHPATGDSLVRHQTASQRVGSQGRVTRTRGHRAGWDATFSARKSVSLTALVGGDDRVRAAHAASVEVALDALQDHVQARLGGALTPETTRTWVAATFEHDSARPVDGYAAPQLHTHVVVFNLTEMADGRIRPLQPRELFRSQAFATAVYRSELAHRLVELGYAIERGGSGQPEIRGYSARYLEASSPRRQQIAAHLAARGTGGAAAAEIAAHHTRDAKIPISAAAVLRQHRTLAEVFGDQPTQVRQAAYAHGPRRLEAPERAASEALAYSVARNFERHAVVSERMILRDALDRSQGSATLADVQGAVAEAQRARALIAFERPPHRTDQTLTTPAMLQLERDTAARMRAGQGRAEPIDRSRTEAARYPHLNLGQAQALREIVESRDQILGLDGVAGAGKTTVLAAVRRDAERAGYTVRGLAPTSRATQLLQDAGIAAETLQAQLTRPPPALSRAPVPGRR